VEPGPVVWLRNLQVEGRGDVPHWMVEESIRLDPDRPFVAAELVASRNALLQRRLVRRVGATIFDVAPDTVDVAIRLEPGGARSRAVGAGYGSEEKFRVRGSWIDRNFYGGGRTLDLEARFSSLKRELEVAFTQPRFPTRSVTFEASLRPGYQLEETYDLRGGELELLFRRRLNEQASYGAGIFLAAYGIEQKTEDDPDFDPALDRGAELRAVFVRNTSDNPLTSTRGSALFASAAVADRELLGSATYAAGNVDYRWYREIGGRHVLALRQHCGVALPGGSSPTLPVWRRQYGGGSNDMRSYRRRTLGPVDSQGRGLGGELLTISIVELRLYHTRRIGLAVFGEMGQVWRKLGDARVDELRFGLGGGLRFNTPVGPIRLDLGLKTGGYDPSLKPRVWHVSIGEAF
jgi:outer membrane translocation and assembly module TamA